MIERLPQTKQAFLSPTVWHRFTHHPLDTTLYSHNHKKDLCPHDERTVVILYHKPPNVITSHSNADALPADSTMTTQRRTVYQDIETLKGYRGGVISSLKEIGIHSKLHAVGRLDADTTGLLLLTNDGGLVHHVTNPTACSIVKTYEAVIMGYWNDTSSELMDMRHFGVDIGSKYGGQTKPPIALRVLDHPTLKSTRIEISIQEGKNRQVRRMFHAIRSGVMKLHRTSIGNNLTLGDLREGEWRILTNEEVKHYMDWMPRLLEPKASAKNRIVSENRRGYNTKRGKSRVLSSRQKRKKM